MILLSSMEHRLTIYSRTPTQGALGEPVFTYKRLARTRGLAVPKAGRLEQDTSERRPQNYQVYSMVSPLIRAGLWVKVEARSVTGFKTLLTGQIRSVDNPNFSNDHLELVVSDGGDPIDV